jgi:hypothetical protein
MEGNENDAGSRSSWLIATLPKKGRRAWVAVVCVQHFGSGGPSDPAADVSPARHLANSVRLDLTRQ